PRDLRGSSRGLDATHDLAYGWRHHPEFLHATFVLPDELPDPLWIIGRGEQLAAEGARRRLHAVEDFRVPRRILAAPLAHRRADGAGRLGRRAGVVDAQPREVRRAHGDRLGL